MSNRVRSELTALAALTLLAASCHKAPRPRVEIPDPVGQKNVWLAYDGEKLVWMPIVGGPSGAIDTTSHFGEVELVAPPTAKYLRSPVSYAKEPAAGQLVVFGPAGASEQAIEASGMSAPYLAIDGGILKAAKAPESTGGMGLIFGWTGDQAVAANATWYAGFGSKALGSNAATNVFPMPVAGKFTQLLIAIRNTQPASGTLEVGFAKAGEPLAGIKLTLAAGSVSAVYSATGEVPVAQKDLVQIQLVNGATANSAAVVAMSAVFEYQ
jgi:hypothetical protein